MIRRLGVNVDHVATLRQVRGARYPDPLAAALVAERAGADQVTIHLRVDRRHVQDDDVSRMAASVQTYLNVECAVTAPMRAIMLARRPHRVTLVAERAEEVTTEGGLDVVRNRGAVAEFAAAMIEAGIRVSLFVDPDPAQVDASCLPGVDMVELNTARYAEGDGPEAVARLVRATAQGVERGLQVAAGHGLTLHNLAPLVRAAPAIEEYNIGHALIADAVFLGLDASVRRYKALLA